VTTTNITVEYNKVLGILAEYVIATEGSDGENINGVTMMYNPGKRVLFSGGQDSRRHFAWAGLTPGHSLLRAQAGD
jgi:uncharacterized protein (DUF342 family)